MLVNIWLKLTYLGEYFRSLVLYDCVIKAIYICCSILKTRVVLHGSQVSLCKKGKRKVLLYDIEKLAHLSDGKISD